MADFRKLTEKALESIVNPIWPTNVQKEWQKSALEWLQGAFNDSCLSLRVRHFGPTFEENQGNMILGPSFHCHVEEVNFDQLKRGWC